MVKRTPEEYKACYRKNNSKSWGNNFQAQNGNLIIRKSAEGQWYKFPTNILNIKKDDIRDGTQHPTQKPVALFEYLIKTYTNDGNLVLDNCIGSGTTAIACINAKRNFIGIEMSKEYLDIAETRIANLINQKKLF